MKCRHEAINEHNESRPHHVVAIDANLLARKSPAGADPVKHVDLIATMFSSSGVGVMVHACNPTCRFDAKRESMRRKCDRELDH